MMIPRFAPLRPLIAAGAVAACGLSASAQTCADHGVPANGFPNWRERAFLTLTNACRTSPQQYRAAYLPSAPNILGATAYPAVPPLQWTLGLNQAARYKSTQLATVPGCPFQHNNCDNSSWSARITSFYPNWSTIGENIAAGYADPLSTLNQLLRDDDINQVPAADHSGYDGHRENIMTSSFTVVGCGWAVGSNQYQRYWTQDFARPSGAFTICSPISAASHIIQSGQVVFLANYYDAANAAPQSATIVINGVSTPLTVQLGTAARGTYRYATTTGATCRSYHFEFRNAAGTLQRYPARGELRTTTEGNCTEEFVDGPVTPPPCAPDMDASGTVTVADIFAFLTLWFAADPRADFNHAAGVNTADIFDYLRAWFTGC